MISNSGMENCTTEARQAKKGDLGFDRPRSKLTAQQAIMLNIVEEELPSTSDVAKANDIKLHEITKNAVRSTENLISQLQEESLDNFPMCKVIRVDKQLRSIRGSLKVEMVKA